MKRRLKRKSNRPMVLIIICCVITIGAAIFFHLNYLKEIRTDYIDKINMLTMEYKSKEVRVYQAKVHILAGSVLTEENVAEITALTDQTGNYYMTSENIGNITLVDIKKGTWIYKDMLRKDMISNNLREVEYSTFFIGNNINQNDYFDLHIQYPNGEDYIVLSKTLIKRIDQINEHLYLWLTPEELLNISGAIVDCYLNEGTRLYSVKYIEPAIQEASYLTYTPNADIISLMKREPNIVNAAISGLSEQVRMELEERLYLFYKQHESYKVNEEDSIYYPGKNTIIGEEDDYENNQYSTKEGAIQENITREEEVYYVD